MTTLPDMKQLKREITVTRVLADYGVTLRRSGAGLAGPCPIHKSSPGSRALHVTPDARGWYCFGSCRRGGSVIDLVAAMEQCSIRRAAEILARRYGVG